MNEIIIPLTAAAAVALNSAAKFAKGLLTSLLGPTADVYGQMLANGTQLRLLENQIKNFKKVQKIVNENKINIKEVDLKVLFPYLNNVAIEEEESLQDIWANLFVNYIDASKNLKVTVYPSILSQLSTQDVEIAKYMTQQTEGRIMIESSQDVNLMFKFLESLPNLVRLGIVIQTFQKDPGRTIIGSYPPPKMSADTTSYFELTNFGWNFLGACSR